MQHQFDHQDRQGGSFMLGLMAGTALGAGVALLFAPREGAEMRRELSRGAHKFGESVSRGADYVRATARRAADSASEALDRGQSAYRDAASRVRKAAEGGAQAVDDVVNRAAETARHAIDETEARVERGADRVDQRW